MNQIDFVAPLHSAVDRNGRKKFRKDCFVKGLRPSKAALRALDKTILSKHTPAIAIDGFLKSTKMNETQAIGNHPIIMRRAAA